MKIVLNIDMDPDEFVAFLDYILQTRLDGSDIDLYKVYKDYSVKEEKQKDKGDMDGKE